MATGAAAGTAASKPGFALDVAVTLGTVSIGDVTTSGGAVTADIGEIGDADSTARCVLSWASSDTVLSNSVRAKTLQAVRTPRPYRDIPLDDSPSVGDRDDGGMLLARLAEGCCVWFD
jgi:hypothetical protein